MAKRSQKLHECRDCHKRPLTKDELGATRKLLDPDAREFYCLDCLANLLDCTVEDITTKIEEFKEEGCKLFE